MRKYIFNAFNILVGILWLISVSALDSKSWIPTIVCAAATLYFAVLAYLAGKKGAVAGK